LHPLAGWQVKTAHEFTRMRECLRSHSIFVAPFVGVGVDGYAAPPPGLA
jgi:hypothetical protein